MPEEELFKTKEQVTRTEIAEALRDAADQIESGDVTLESDAEEQTVTVPESPRFEVELERLTDSESGDQRYELEYEIKVDEVAPHCADFILYLDHHNFNRLLSDA